MTYDPVTYWPARYERQGPSYVAKGGSTVSDAEQLADLTPILRGLPSGGTVLDFGCGPGRFRPVLEERFDAYVGMDLIQGFGTEPLAPVAGRGFDAIVTVFVLQHIVDEAIYTATVTDLYEGLSEGGYLFVVDSEPVDSPAAHMAPRGFDALADAFPWTGATRTGTYRNHWTGLFVR